MKKSTYICLLIATLTCTQALAQTPYDGVGKPGFSVVQIEIGDDIDEIQEASQAATGSTYDYNPITRESRSIFEHVLVYPRTDFGEDGFDYPLQTEARTALITAAKLILEEPGDYTFSLHSDATENEAGLVINVLGFNAPLGFEPMVAIGENPIGSIYLDTVTGYTIATVQYGELESLKLWAAPGVHDSFNDKFVLVGDVANGGIRVTTTPEPSGIVLLGTALIPLGMLRKRRA